MDDLERDIMWASVPGTGWHSAVLPLDGQPGGIGRILNWVTNNRTGRWTIVEMTRRALKIAFEVEEDAVHARLRWA